MCYNLVCFVLLSHVWSNKKSDRPFCPRVFLVRPQYEERPPRGVVAICSSGCSCLYVRSSRCFLSLLCDKHNKYDRRHIVAVQSSVLFSFVSALVSFSLLLPPLQLVSPLKIFEKPDGNSNSQKSPGGNRSLKEVALRQSTTHRSRIAAIDRLDGVLYMYVYIRTCLCRLLYVSLFPRHTFLVLVNHCVWARYVCFPCSRVTLFWFGLSKLAVPYACFVSLHIFPIACWVSIHIFFRLPFDCIACWVSIHLFLHVEFLCIFFRLHV